MRRPVLLLAAMLAFAPPAFAQSPAVRAAIRSAPALDADAQKVIAAMTVKPPAARQRLISTLVRCEKSFGVWPLLDDERVLWAHDEQASRINWKTPGVNTAIAVNSPAFTVDRGWAFDGSTNYLNLQASQATGPNLAASSAMMAAWESANVVGSNTATAGGGAGSAILSFNARGGGSVFTGRPLSSTSITFATGVVDSRGLSAVQTNGSTADGFRNGVVAASGVAVTSPSATLSTYPILVGGRSSAGAATDFRAATVSFYAHGARLSATQHAGLYAYRQAVGAP